MWLARLKRSGSVVRLIASTHSRSRGERRSEFGEVSVTG
jgi:hypothetical protein